MQKNSRIKYSVANLLSGFCYRILIMVTAFIVRTVFIKCLNEEYLGINGLYSNILSMLSLAELGFGTAMVYSMYQPLANKDYEKLSQLMKLYKQVYSIVGAVVLVLGILIVPFLDLLIKNKPDINGLTFYYLLFLGNSVVSYWFFAYRLSIFQADQKSYVITRYQSLFNLIKSVFQIIVLLVFKNFTAYLIIQILCTIAQNFAISCKAKRNYPIWCLNKNDSLPQSEKKKIFKDVRALMLAKVSHVILNGTDNMIISAFVNINSVGLLSNYYLITEAVSGILTQITGAITASLGNFFAIESKDAGYQMFKKFDFLNFWLYGFSIVAFVGLLNPFITLWIGSKFLLDKYVILALSLNFIVAGFMNTLWTFRSTLGLFTQGRIRPLIVSLLNIILSILFSYKWGVAGVLFATSISRLLVNLWYDPLLLHKYGFNKSVLPYYKKMILRGALLGIIVFFIQIISNEIFRVETNIINFIIMVIIVVIVPNFIFFVIYFKTDEFQYFFKLLISLFYKIKNNLDCRK